MEKGASLVIMGGGDSWFEGRGFKSYHCILDGHFSHIPVVKFVMKINSKEAEDGPFFTKKAKTFI